LRPQQIKADLADNFLKNARPLFRSLQVDCAGGYLDSRPKIRLVGGFAHKADQVDIPLLFKQGWLGHQPMIPFLNGADGVVSNFNK
jgi:hypothetical protein